MKRILKKFCEVLNSYKVSYYNDILYLKNNNIKKKGKRVIMSNFIQARILNNRPYLIFTAIFYVS